MKKTVVLFLMFWACVCTSMAQQSRIVTGQVVSSGDNLALPGVNILIKGTTQGTSTDIDGNYNIQVPDSLDTLIFSFIGFETQEVQIRNRTEVNVTMEPSILSAGEELVVVGYGRQEKRVVTGAISSVKATDLESMPVNRVEEALQGRTSGLTIASNSGQPGSGSTVRVRGITTLGNNNPLWVVDGVVVDAGGIGYLNQSDIESIEVLKDAASQAIYGARAAAGVILITTKKGAPGDIRVNYNTSYGILGPAKKLDLLNATQYATIRNEASVAAGGGVVFNNPESLGQGTDWQSLIFNNRALRQDHEFSVSGGNDKSTFYASFGHLNEEGIVTTDISNYKRTNIRLNSTHQLTEWLTLGQNLGYAHDKSVGLGNTNSEFGGPLSSAINLDPITPAVITDPDAASEAPYNTQPVVRNAQGNPYGISTIVGQEMVNPLAYVQTRLGNYGWSDNIVGNIYAEAEPIEGLSVRSTLGAKLAYWGGESFSPVSYLNATNITSQTSFARNKNRRFDWNLENTVAYQSSFRKHNYTVLLGQGAYLNNYSTSLNLTYYDIPVDNFDDASMNYNIPTDQRIASGSEGTLHAVTSLFARLNYNFNEKYLFEGLIRRDGSSRFGPNNKYGVFPSFSLGWVVSEENFWPLGVISFLKLRGGYGVVGNDNIGDFAYLSTIGSGRNYTIGNSGSYIIGYSPNAPSNPDLRWEETSQLNIGFEATVFHDFTLTFDWYQKVTKGILQNPRIPGYVGAISNPAANVADMQNTGIELELGYRKQIGQVSLSLNGNVSYLQNEVTNLGDGIEYLSGGQGFQASSYPITRTAVGHAVNSFYGFKSAGIFQTEEDVDNYVDSEGNKILPDAKPGDFRWMDLNEDGQITEDDRTFIGNPTPDWSYGLTVNLAWKNFDMILLGQGVAGNQIFQGLRRLDITNANWQTRALERWTGEGTSTAFPRLVDSDPNGNFTNPSEFYLEDGSYFRIKTVQLGYSFPLSLSSKVGLQKARIYVMSENLLTITGYTGYDPEIGGGVMSIDRGIYPQARSFMVGLNIGL